MANNTDWLNISQITGGTGQTVLSLTALTNTSLQPKTATITARNTEHNVSDTTTVTIQGFQPTLTLSRSTLRFDSTGGTATFTVYSNTSWTIQFPSLVRSYSASAGTGDMEISVVVGLNPDEEGKVDTATVKDIYNVNQLFLTIVQDSFISELTVIPDSDIVFDNTGSSTSVIIETNTDWEITCPYWVTPSVVSGGSGTTTVTFTAGENGPIDRSGDIIITAGSKEVIINAFQPFFIPAYITVTPSSWEFNYTEDGRTFIVDSYPAWSGEIIATGETAWDTTYMEATFVIPSAMTMPLYDSLNDTTGIFNGPVKIFGDSITFETSGTYKIRYEIRNNGQTPSIHSAYLTNLYFSEGIKSLGGFSGCSSLSGISSDCVKAPSITSTVFQGVASGGTLVYPIGSNYNAWLSPAEYCLGYYGWPGFSGKTYMTVEYNVTSTTNPTKIIQTNVEAVERTKIFSKVTLEDGEIIFDYDGGSFSTGYTFSETGSNKLRFYPKTSTIPDEGSYVEGCFKQCTAITSVELADTTTYFGNCLNGCSLLSSITFNEIVEYIGSLRYLPLTGLTMPDSVTGFYGAGNCTSLRTVKLSESLTSLPQSAFSYCSLLAEITIPPSVQTLGANCFESCTSLRTTDISNVTDIGNECFRGCTSLTDFDFGKIKTIGTRAFSGCTNLTEVVLRNATSIGDYSFQNCSLIENLYIGTGITSISYKAFAGCSRLERIYFGKNVNYINNAAFMGTSSLSSMTIEATVAPTLATNEYPFRSIGRNGVLYYPSGSDYSSWLRGLEDYNWTGQEISFS